MHRKEFLEILQMIEGETVMLVTKALNNNSSHLIATTKMNIKTENELSKKFPLLYVRFLKGKSLLDEYYMNLSNLSKV